MKTPSARTSTAASSSITLDKREEVKPRKIQINATSGPTHNPKQ